MQNLFAIQKAADALRRGDMALAAQISKGVLAENDRMAQAWRILGKAANSLSDFELAEQAFSQGARNSPPGSAERAHDLLLRAEPLICLGRPTEAATSVREAVRLGLRSPYDYFLAALALTHLGLPTEALPLAEQATTLDPRLAEAWNIVGNARQFLGEIDAAEAALNTVVRLSRDQAVAAYHSLAHLKKWKPEKNHIEQLEKFQCRSSHEACRVGYALFKEYDDLGDTEAAWDCLQHAARVGRAMETWTAADERRSFDAWKAAFPSPPLRSNDTRPRTGPKRIFIVGLPRSGTTLVERILTSHSQVQTIGEVNAFAIATRRLANPKAQGIISPEIISAARAVDPRLIAEEYTKQTAYLHDGSDYTIDKRPDNYEYLGLIRQAFPDAVIISLDRNPMDALFGAYKRSFAPGSHGWSYTIDDLAAHYQNFRDLMDHWKGVLGDGLIEVSLETLIAEPEAQIRRLLEACGLPFQDSCLRPHESKGAVTTASALQVRQPINAQGVGAWKRYAGQLAPLRDRLERLGYPV
jgi:tetratricopeptide (TPR) repeat protein